MKSDTNSKDHSRVESSRRITVEEMEMLEVTFYSPSGRGGDSTKEGWLVAWWPVLYANFELVSMSDSWRWLSLALISFKS